MLHASTHRLGILLALFGMPQKERADEIFIRRLLAFSSSITASSASAEAGVEAAVEEASAELSDMQRRGSSDAR